MFAIRDGSRQRAARFKAARKIATKIPAKITARSPAFLPVSHPEVQSSPRSPVPAIADEFTRSARPTEMAGHHGEIDYFLLFGLWPAGVFPDENGDGVAPPFLIFLSAFGFFFSLLLRI
jgi:hypothetical protein